MISLLLIWGLLSTKCNSLPDIDSTRDCEVLRMKCAYRSNCAKSLHSYMVDCADVLSGRTSRCPWACKRALISLTSHEIGFALDNCDCHENEFCLRSKERAEVCRPEVAHATADNTTVACSVAEWICAADPLCSTALEYYHRLCRSMFHGRKCTPRCNNSLNILERQEKAAKLRHCYCDGSEDFPCTHIRENTRKLCRGLEESKPDTTSAPFRTHSGSERNVKLSRWMVGACLLVLWTLRMCTSDGSYIFRTTRTLAIRNHHLKDYGRCRRTNFKIWPWWWTSENPVH